MTSSPNWRQSRFWPPLLLFGGFLALRLSFRAQYLINWDAANFALGTQLFNLEGSFRHLTYYLPNYPVYGVGRDLRGSLGHLFTAYNGTSDYTVEGLETAQESLDLPDEVLFLIIPDGNIYRRLRGGDLYALELESSSQVVVVRIPQRTTLVFENPHKADARIVLEEIAHER